MSVTGQGRPPGNNDRCAWQLIIRCRVSNSVFRTINNFVVDSQASIIINNPLHYELLSVKNVNNFAISFKSVNSPVTFIDITKFTV